MKISIILGTRPEIIKLSPLMCECIRLDRDFYTLHTGQHYAYCMDRIFFARARFEQLVVPEAKYNLDVVSGTHAA